MYEDSKELLSTAVCFFAQLYGRPCNRLDRRAQGEIEEFEEAGGSPRAPTL